MLILKLWKWFDRHQVWNFVKRLNKDLYDNFTTIGKMFIAFPISILMNVILLVITILIVVLEVGWPWFKYLFIRK